MPSRGATLGRDTDRRPRRVVSVGDREGCGSSSGLVRLDIARTVPNKAEGYSAAYRNRTPSALLQSPASTDTPHNPLVVFHATTLQSVHESHIVLSQRTFTYPIPANALIGSFMFRRGISPARLLWSKHNTNDLIISNRELLSLAANEA